MKKDFFFGLGLGLLIIPAIDYLKTIPFLGQYVPVIMVITGFVLIVKGYMMQK